MWRHLLGWHPEGRAAGRSGAVLGHTRAAHAEALATSAGRMPAPSPREGARGDTSLVPPGAAPPA